MISDFGEFSYIFKDMIWRADSIHTKSFIPELKKLSDKNRNKISKYSLHNKLSKIEDLFGKYITKELKKLGYKSYGFNISHIKDLNYIEFRYAGGKIPEETLLNKLYYLCYIVLIMTQPNYKRREYLKKLYKFLTN